MDQLKYDSLYSGLVSINKSLGGTQSMPDSEYGAMIDLMETLSGQPVGESGDAYNAISTVATMAENGELPIQMKLDSVDVDITANGRYDYQPSAYGLDGFSGFVANVNVPDSSRLGVKSVNINQNGHQEFHAIDFDLDGFSTIGIDVNVPTGGGGKFQLFDGIKLGSSTFSTVPDVFDFSKVTDMSCMFMSCESLTTVPQLDTSSATNMSYMFTLCGSLTTVPQLDTSSVTNMRDMFSSCYVLPSIPLLNTSNVTDMRAMFDNCESLTTIPQLDTSNVTEMRNMFKNCTSLTNIPLLNTSNVTFMGGMFTACSSLTTIPQLDTSKVTNIMHMFERCSALESIPLLDCGNVTRAGEIINPAYEADQIHLTDLGGFKNLKVSIDIQRAPNLTVQSLMNVINNLYDFVGNSETGTNKILTLGTTNLDKLTDEQKAVATNKGWQLS